MRFKYLLSILILSLSQSYGNDILGCGGFVKSHVALDVSNIEIGLYTKEGSLVERTECAPTNGYYFVPLYEKGDYVLKVHPPAGWSFEPSEVELSVDGETDQCSTGEDVNFSFNGFGITGTVITAGKQSGPSGISVQLVNDKGQVRNTVTGAGGDFHFTPVIPGNYVLKASHSRWKLEPAQANVQVKEGNTVLPVGVLAVKGYDVSGSVISFGNPIAGVYVLLYSKEDNPKFRVEGCKTALLQGVPDSPICYSITDQSGEFHFGVVPAGEYTLLALSKTPGQATVTYNIKPDSVMFTVHHDSQYIKNAFEITGFTVVGTALASKGGKAVSGARVLLGGEPVATTDSAGKFALTALTPGLYTVTLQHEQCEWDEIEVRVAPGGVSGSLQAAAARWRVCGSVAPLPAPARRVSLRAGGAGAAVHVSSDANGEWCTFLAAGTYTARVDVTEQEHRDGLQFYPEWQQVEVAGAPVAGVAFSQLRAHVVGRVDCAGAGTEAGPGAGACAALRVALRSLAADGSYLGQPTYTELKSDGTYEFEDVLPGSVEVSVDSSRVCWQESAHNVAVVSSLATVPNFVLKGLVLRLVCSHDMEVEYRCGEARGVLAAPPGASAQCVPRAPACELAPRGCHRVQPARATATFADNRVPTVEFTARSHAAVVRVEAREPADLTLRLETDSERSTVSPRYTEVDAGYVYEHTLYLAEGEVVTVTPQSGSLLFSPAQQRLVGSGRCDPAALTVRATRGVTVSGRIVPPVAEVLVTLSGDDVKLTQVTKEDGAYSFGPLAAGRRYDVTAEKPSYAFGAPDARGDIPAHELAEIRVLLVDDADDAPLEGALVSVSGGAYRRNAASGADGRLAFGSLGAAQYYVKANMKEYRFAPPHHLVDVGAGAGRGAARARATQLVFRGTRVAWSVSGRAVSLGGVGAAGVGLRARPGPAPSQTVCAAQDATASPTGHFRIRGLVPGYRYTLELREAAGPAGSRLARAPPPVQVMGKDIEDVQLIVIQPTQLTDCSVLVHAHAEHYRTLKLTLALADTEQALWTGGAGAAVGAGGAGGAVRMHALPRLPADNRTYSVRLTSALSRLTHAYEEPVVYFTSDGSYRHFDMHFVAKVKSSEQELRATSFLLLPLLLALAAAALHRDRLLARLRPDGGKRLPRKKTQ